MATVNCQYKQDSEGMLVTYIHVLQQGILTERSVSKIELPDLPGRFFQLSVAQFGMDYSSNQKLEVLVVDVELLWVHLNLL
jgi:hypothetical protein